MRDVRSFCPLFRGFFYEGFVLALSGLLSFVRYLEVPAIRDVRYQRFHCTEQNTVKIMAVSIFGSFGELIYKI